MDGGERLPEHLHLVRGELVEHVLADRGHVAGCGRFQDRRAGVGELSQGTASVAGSLVATDPTGAFQSRRGVGETTGGGVHSLGEFAHGQSSIGRFRQHHQDDVVPVQNARVLLQLTIKRLV